MSFYDMLKSLVDKVVLPRKARKEARRVGDIMQDALSFGKNKRGDVFVFSNSSPCGAKKN